MKKVVKFGGSSLASAEQFKKVGAIIKADESRVFVVPSAPGKRFSDDTKVTDMLLHVYQTAAVAEHFHHVTNPAGIQTTHIQILQGCAVRKHSVHTLDIAHIQAG